MSDRHLRMLAVADTCMSTRQCAASRTKNVSVCRLLVTRADTALSLNTQYQSDDKVGEYEVMFHSPTPSVAGALPVALTKHSIECPSDYRGKDSNEAVSAGCILLDLLHPGDGH